MPAPTWVSSGRGSGSSSHATSSNQSEIRGDPSTCTASSGCPIAAAVSSGPTTRSRTTDVPSAGHAECGAAVSAGARAAAARASDARWSPSTSPAAAARATRSVSVTMALCDGVSIASG